MATQRQAGTVTDTQETKHPSDLQHFKTSRVRPSVGHSGQSTASSMIDTNKQNNVGHLRHQEVQHHYNSYVWLTCLTGGEISQNFWSPSGPQWKKVGWFGQYWVVRWGSVLCAIPTFNTIRFCWSHISFDGKKVLGFPMDHPNGSLGHLVIYRSPQATGRLVILHPGLSPRSTDNRLIAVVTWAAHSQHPMFCTFPFRFAC